MTKTTIIISPKSDGWITPEQGNHLKDKLLELLDEDLFNVLIVGLPIDVNSIGKDSINHVQITGEWLENTINYKSKNKGR